MDSIDFSLDRCLVSKIRDYDISKVPKNKQLKSCTTSRGGKLAAAPLPAFVRLPSPRYPAAERGRA